MTNLADLITYIISELVDMESSFGKTKLVKLLYLIDVEAYRLHGHTLTGLNWIFYHYGPYTTEIDEVLKQLDLDVPQEAIITRSGHVAKVFKPSRDLTSNFAKSSTIDKLIVDRVIETWGLEELNELLNYVYFNTEPMQNAERGCVLDFSTVRRSVKRPFVPVSSSFEHRQEIRDKFEKYVQKNPMVMNLNPKPRFDTFFWDGVTNIYIDDQLSVPPGQVSITEENKKEIHRQSSRDEIV